MMKPPDSIQLDYHQETHVGVIWRWKSGYSPVIIDSTFHLLITKEDYYARV
jgi:hypothetical protein